MAVAAVTPRVRTIVICDEVVPSLLEAGVFTLEGVRQHLEPPSLPWRATLSLFMLLSSPRKGSYSAKILIVNERYQIAAVNRAAETLFGYSAADAAGRSVLELIQEAETGDLRQTFEHALHPVTSLVRRSSLEDVFLRLTGRSLIE